MIKKRRGDYGSGNLRDGDTKKRYPNSMTAIVRGIVAHWLSADKPLPERTKLTPKAFLDQSDFVKVYYETLDLFPAARVNGHRFPEEDETKRKQAVITMLESFGADSKSKALDYFHIRAFADYLKISESTFLTILKMCSIERRAGDKSEFEAGAFEYIQAQRRTLDKMEHLIKTDEFKGFTHSAGFDAGANRDIWIAETSLLREIANAFSDGKIDFYNKIMKRD